MKSIHTPYRRLIIGIVRQSIATLLRFLNCEKPFQVSIQVGRLVVFDIGGNKARLIAIEDNENKYVLEPVGDPISSLKHFMEEHNLRQSDLPEIGSQGVVSEILNGKRQLNVAQIKALSKRFKVSPAAFLQWRFIT